MCLGERFAATANVDGKDVLAVASLSLDVVLVIEMVTFPRPKGLLPTPLQTADLPLQLTLPVEVAPSPQGAAFLRTRLLAPIGGILFRKPDAILATMTTLRTATRRLISTYAQAAMLAAWCLPLANG